MTSIDTFTTASGRRAKSRVAKDDLACLVESRRLAEPLMLQGALDRMDQSLDAIRLFDEVRTRRPSRFAWRFRFEPQPDSITARFGDSEP